MAIDTVSKRMSALNFGGLKRTKLVPDGDMKQDDRQIGLGSYIGIEAFDEIWTDVTVVTAESWLDV